MNYNIDLLKVNREKIDEDSILFKILLKIIIDIFIIE